MIDVCIAHNKMFDDAVLCLKSIWETHGKDGEYYHCPLNGDVYFCFIFVVKGTVEINTTQQYRVPIRKGNAVFMWSNEIQSYKCIEDVEFFWVYFQFSGKSIKLFTPFQADIEKTSKTLRYCIGLLLKNSYFDTMRANMVFTKIFLDGLEKISNENDEGKPKQMAILDSADYIKENLYELPSVKEIANMYGMTQKRFCLVFNKVVGMYPSKFIGEQKLLTVKNYLLNSDMTLAEISCELGYSSPFYLSERFKKRYKLSPKEFREKNKKR